MATISETSKILSAISELKSQIAALEVKMGSLSLVPEPLKPAKAAKKPRDPEAPKRAPTEWILFTNRVRALLKANEYPVGAEVQQFCSHLKEEQDMYKWTDDSILASRKLWTAPERKSREAKSDAEEPKPEKPKKVLSPEHLAKLAEGRARKAAEKKAAALTPLNPFEDAQEASPEQSETESTSSSGSKKRGPKKGTKLSEEQKAARKAKMTARTLEAAAKIPLPDSDKEEGEVTEDESEVQFNPLIIKGKRYMWNPQNNHCYYREEDSSKGDWAGLLTFQNKGQPFITPAPEPEV